MSSTLSIYVGEAATPQLNGGDGTPGRSVAGHMWLGLDASDLRSAKSMGFAPLKHGSFQGDGMVVRDDSFNYFGPNVHRIDIEVTDAQRENILKFAENPKAYGFDMRYQGVSNSCIDFAWKALDVAGINPTHTEGRILPTDNLPELQKLAQDMKNSPVQQGLLQTERAQDMGPRRASETQVPLALEATSGGTGSPELANAFRDLPKDLALQRYPELQRAYQAQDAARTYAEKLTPKGVTLTSETFMKQVNGQLERQLHDFGPSLTDPRRQAQAQAHQEMKPLAPVHEPTFHRGYVRSH